MANQRMREFWSGAGAQGWVEHQRLFDAELAAFADVVVDAVDPWPGARLLDIGCGTGALLELTVARGATGVGVDISPAMVAAAAKRIPRAEFVVADAQTDDLAAHGPFDAVVSRFGVMFFDDPVTAFANIRAAARPGSPLVFVCWRSVAENPIFTLGTSVLVQLLDPPSEPPAPDAPGPTAFADAERVRAILAGSGWREVEVSAYDATCDYGTDGSDGVEERLAMILGTTTGQLARERLEPTLGPKRWAALLDDVRAEVGRHLVDGRVQLPGAAWLVTARA